MTLAAPGGLIGHAELLAGLRGYTGHALLLSGPARVGKRALARHLAAMVNCREPGPPCGVCPSCRQALAGQHPDLLEIGPRALTSTGKAARRRIISVGAMVEGRGEPEGDSPPLVGWLETAPTVRRKVAVIDGAEFLSAEAANAILKSVEEPPHRALFVFLAEEVGAVLPTIVSRCARVNVNPLTDRELAAALARLGESPDPELLAFAAGRPGVVVERERARAALAEARSFTEALADGMLPALEAAEALEKRFDPLWHPEALRFVGRDRPDAERARADDALERLLSALEQYVSPSLAFQVLALDLRAAIGEG